MSTPHRRVKLLIATLLSLGLMLVMVGVVSAHTSYPAHAKVNKAIPAIGSTISQAPTSVTVFTLENMAPGPSKSNLFVYSPAGDLISQGNATVSLTNPREMSITIKPDPANLKGIYVVRWITGLTRRTLKGSMSCGGSLPRLKMATPTREPLSSL